MDTGVWTMGTISTNDLLSKAARLRAAAEQVKLDSIAKVNQLLGAADAYENLAAEMNQKSDMSALGAIPPVLDEAAYSNNGHEKVEAPH